MPRTGRAVLHYAQFHWHRAHSFAYTPADHVSQQKLSKRTSIVDNAVNNVLPSVLQRTFLASQVMYDEELAAMLKE
jgi:hypothetical protein